MAKQDEKSYYGKLDDDGRQHADNKPFSDAQCGKLLVDIGQMMALLPSPPATILDLGCGTGWTSEFMNKAGYNVIGIDISRDIILSASRARSTHHLNFVVGDFEKIPFSGRFDAVACFGSVHHCEDLNAVLAACKRVLKSGGRLILMEPGEGHSEDETSRKFVAEYGLTEKSLPPKLLYSILSEVGFHDIRVYPWLGLHSSALNASSPIAGGWKYKLAATIMGAELARALQFAAFTRKTAVVTATA